MTNTERGKTYSLVAAICFSLLAVYGIYNLISELIIYINYSYSISLYAALRWIVAIGLAVTLFIKNKLAVTIAAGAYTLCYLCSLIVYFNISMLLTVLAAIAVFVLLILSLSDNKAVKAIWFISGALFFISTLVEWIQYEFFYSLSVERVIYMFSSLVEIAGLLFIGLWLKECVSPVEYSPVNGYTAVNYQTTYAAPAGYGSAGQVNGYAAVNSRATNVAPVGYGAAGQVNGYAASNPQTTYAAPAGYGSAGDIEKLNMCKTLLDAGAITQEEFDAKKKEILGL